MSQCHLDLAYFNLTYFKSHSNLKLIFFIKQMQDPRLYLKCILFSFTRKKKKQEMGKAVTSAAVPKNLQFKIIFIQNMPQPFLYSLKALL